MTAKLQLAVEVPSLPRSCRRLRRFGSLRRLRTAARVQLAAKVADGRECSARRFAADVVLYAELHELAAEFLPSLSSRLRLLWRWAKAAGLAAAEVDVGRESPA
jgi:hypothetical protein